MSKTDSTVRRMPVISLAELDALDDAEMREGYLDGFAGEAEPGGNRSKSFWHGWRNGRVDGGHDRKDAAQAVLAERCAARNGRG